MKECVLVAGGAGYIGTHTAVELIEAGYDVVIVDNLSNSEMKAVEGVREITGRNVPFERVDCDDRQALAGVFDRYRFGAVIHFAASKAVGESVEKPLLYYRNNILSLLNVLDLMREKGVRNLVFSSSCTVYGQPEALPVTEQTPRQPATSPYGNTKQICEDILRDTVAAYPELCGIAGLAFLGGSYMAEAFRSGLEAVSPIQTESALSLGMNRRQTMGYVVLPQAASISVPAFMANVIFLLKETSVFSAISLMDLMFTAKDLIGLYYKTTESLVLLVVFYLLILLPVSVCGTLLERRLRYAGFGS